MQLENSKNLSPEERESWLQKETLHCSKLIKQAYGIDLLWNEQAILKHYLRCMRQEYERGNKHLIIHGDAMCLFMIDCFGLDINELDSELLVYTHNPKRLKRIRFGLGFVSREWYTGDERFKEYCRRRVQQWRDERELI